MLDVIVFIPDHCLSFYFSYLLDFPEGEDQKSNPLQRSVLPTLHTHYSHKSTGSHHRSERESVLPLELLS